MYGGSSLYGLSAKNTMDIKYTLASEDNAVIRDIEVDDEGNHFIEADSDDLATFFTSYPYSRIPGLYWGSFTDLSFTPAGILCIADDTVTIADGVALDDLDVNYLPQIIYTITNNSADAFIIKSVKLDGVEVFSGSFEVASGEAKLLSFLNDYQSFDTSVISDLDVEVVYVLGATTDSYSKNFKLEVQSDSPNGVAVMFEVNSGGSLE